MSRARKRIAELAGRCLEYAAAERGPAQLNIPRDYFYGDSDYDIPVPRKISQGAGDEDALRQAAELLANAKFPVIVAGGGVIFCGRRKRMRRPRRKTQCGGGEQLFA